MNIHEKLTEIQTNIKAPKNLFNDFGKYHYRNAEGICEAVKPYLKQVKASLRLSDEVVEIGGKIYLKATATLTDNEEIGECVSVSAYARESTSKKGMDDSQITGTASSYARKYALNGLFLLDDTKDADSNEYHNENESKSQSKSSKGTQAPAKATAKQTEKAEVDYSSRIAELNKEFERTGIDINYVLNMYKVKSLEDIAKSDKHYESVMGNFRATPDKKKTS